MPEIKFSGSSDDNFQIDGAIEDEIGCYDQSVVLQINDPGGNCLNVVGHYGFENAGMWMVGVQSVDDNVWGPWKMRYSMSKSGYSPVLSIDVPCGTTVVQVIPKLSEEVCSECGRPHETQRWVVE